MKVTKIEMKDFFQFEKGLSIDLTYPIGHDKAGLPLDKVCIIGQSGTGKTTLLKLIKGFESSFDELDKQYGIEKITENIYISFESSNLKYKKTLGLVENPTEGKSRYINLWAPKSITIDGNPAEFEAAKKLRDSLLKDVKIRTIYMPADMNISPAEFSGTDAPFNQKKAHFDFSQTKIGETWQKILVDIQNHQENELKIRQGISKLVEDGADPSEVDEALQKLKELKKVEFNPLKKIADKCLDPILSHFNLRVKTELDFQKKEDIGFIKIVDSHGVEIPNGLLSTGTKQIILSALPLYLLEPNQTIVLYDEPERSLYPNIQKLIVDLYTSLTKNTQFFFATHSPIIASCFEPWEIVELKFNDEGYVYQQQYFPTNKDRHIDNYSVYPSYLTYDLILSKVFDVPETYSEERTEKMTEILKLRNQLKALQKKGASGTPKAKQINKRYKELGAKLFWDFDKE